MTDPRIPSNDGRYEFRQSFLEEFRTWRYFHVETADGRRRYRINYGVSGNVSLVEHDGEAPLSKHGFPIRPNARFCMHCYHPEGSIPAPDHMLAQKLLLESEGGEAEFLALANVS